MTLKIREIKMKNISHILRNNSYSRYNAAAYAVSHALDPNPAYRYFDLHGDGGGDCSNFISQCLRAGGAPMAYGSKRPWWYDDNGTFDVSDDRWSVSWAVAHSLYWTLKVRGKLNLPGIKGMEVPYIDMLELGDIIQYENHKGLIYHSAIITDFTLERGVRVPLISQHTYNMLNISHIKPAASRMHFMKIMV